LHKCRFIATGGILKNILQESDETNDDLLLMGEGQADADKEARLYFDWWRHLRRYKRTSSDS
jgi:hypothetical protein